MALALAGLGASIPSVAAAPTTPASIIGLSTRNFTVNGAPRINGTMQVGRTVTVVGRAGVFSPAPAGWRYQWMRGNWAIPGATNISYTIQPNDAGRPLSVRVTAIRNGVSNRTVTTPARDVAAATGNNASGGSGLGRLGYPDFTTQEFSGTGSQVINLAANRTSGIVTATHNGRSNFVVWGLDADNQRVSGALVFNEIGQVNGIGGFGLSQSRFQDPVRRIRVESVNNAPALPRSGTGSGVYRWMNPATTWNITHSGRSNFVIWQYHMGRFGLSSRLHVNEIGNFTGSVAAYGGPTIVEIRADGAWRIDR